MFVRRGCRVSMQCLVLVASILLVEAKPITNDSMSIEQSTVSSFTVNDPWSPLVGDTEGAPPVTRRGEPRATLGSARRANNLVENLRRQLMRDNYDYVNNQEEASPSTSTTATTLPTTVSTMTTPPTTISTTTTMATRSTTLSTVVVPNLLKTPSIAFYYNTPMKSYDVAIYPVVRSQQGMQMASVNLTLYQENGVSSVGSPAPVASSPAAPASFYANSAPQPGTHVSGTPAHVLPNSSPIQTPAASIRSFPRPASRPATAVAGTNQKFRSFNEAFNTPAQRVDPQVIKREVFKKDLLYYVDDIRLNNGYGINLRRKYDASDYEDAAYEPSSAQVGQLATTTMADSTHHVKKTAQDHMYEELLRRYRSNNRHTHRHKSKHKHSHIYKNVKGMSKRAKLYGLRIKKPRPTMRYNRRSGQNSSDNYQQNGLRQGKYSNRRSDQSVTKNVQQEAEIENQDGDLSGFPGKPQKKNGTNHNEKIENIPSNEYDDVNNHQGINILDKVNNGKGTANNTVNVNKQYKINSENTQQRDLNDDKQAMQPEDKVNNEKDQNDNVDEGQRNDANVSQRGNIKQSNSSAEETTSNVKYKLLKVRPLGKFRRSGGEVPQRILEERGSTGVALISLDQAPFPQFQLPRSRRQYMQENGHLGNPFAELLPKGTANSRRKRPRSL